MSKVKHPLLAKYVEDHAIRRAIRAYCRRCANKVGLTIKNCPMENQCPLWQHRN